MHVVLHHTSFDDCHKYGWDGKKIEMEINEILEVVGVGKFFLTHRRYVKLAALVGTIEAKASWRAQFLHPSFVCLFLLCCSRSFFGRPLLLRGWLNQHVPIVKGFRHQKIIARRDRPQLWLWLWSWCVCVHVCMCACVHVCMCA